MRTMTWTVFVLTVTGCADVKLDEVRSKWAFGSEQRATSSNTNHVRYSVQTGLEAKLSDGQSIGVVYRRRDDDDADGYSAIDNGVWLEYGFPLWKRKKENGADALKERVTRLEEELAELRQMIAGPATGGGT
jgi:hypothetical protein